MEICDMRTLPALAPRSEDFDSDKTILMRPSLVDTMPTFTVVSLRDWVSRGMIARPTLVQCDVRH